MPTIKLKKATAEYIAEKEREKEREKEKETALPKQKTKVKEKTEPTEMKGLGEVIFEKRKRTIPQAEQTVIDWITDHLLAKSGSGMHLPYPKLYDLYCNSCEEISASVVETTHFGRIINDQVGKEFGFNESSPFKDKLQETKLDVTRSPWKRPSRPKIARVQGGETLKTKLKKVIEEILLEHGNPKSGVSFSKISKSIAAKYPVFRIETRPLTLLTQLNNGIYYKKIEVTKGVGRMGYYRVWGSDDTTEEAKKEEEEMAKTEENGEPEESEKPTKKQKRKKDDGTGVEAKENGDTIPEGEEEEEEETETETDGTPKKKRKKRSSNTKVYKAATSSQINHSNPHSVDDIFPLAITYSSEPKESTLKKMKDYIARYYPEIDIETKFKPALDKGTELGIWEKHGGTYALNIDEFDPNLRDSMDDVICAAIIATKEPKIASAILIKKYVQDYHPNFKIEDRPNRFKNALEKAINRKMLRRISGIGGNGSFVLSMPFTPSPALLAGDEEEEELETIYSKDDAYTDNYIPRPSKSRRHSSGGTGTGTGIASHRAPPKDRSKIVKSSKKTSVPAGIVQRVPKVKKQKRGGRKAAPKAKQEIESEEEVEYAPSAKSPGRKGKTEKKTVTKSPTKGKRKRHSKSSEDIDEIVKEEAEEQEEEEELNSSPSSKKLKGKNKAISKSATKGKRKSLSKSHEEVDESEEDEEEQATPVAKKGKVKSPTKGKRKSLEPEDEAEEEVGKYAASKKRVRNTPQKKDEGRERSSRGKSRTSYKEADESETDRSDD